MCYFMENGPGSKPDWMNDAMDDMKKNLEGTDFQNIIKKFMSFLKPGDDKTEDKSDQYNILMEKAVLMMNKMSYLSCMDLNKYNLSIVPDFLKSLLSYFDSIIIVSHIDLIQDTIEDNECIAEINYNNKTAVSSINYNKQICCEIKIAR